MGFIVSTCAVGPGSHAGGLDGNASRSGLRRLRAEEAAGAGGAVFAPGEAVAMLRRMVAKRKKRKRKKAIGSLGEGQAKGREGLFTFNTLHPPLLLLHSYFLSCLLLWISCLSFWSV